LTGSPVGDPRRPIASRYSKDAFDSANSSATHST
jgi:hypothetical protein